jgi:hypothetical protein
VSGFSPVDDPSFNLHFGFGLLGSPQRLLQCGAAILLSASAIENLQK